jgi:hypothetical protein
MSKRKPVGGRMHEGGVKFSLGMGRFFILYCKKEVCLLIEVDLRNGGEIYAAD